MMPEGHDLEAQRQKYCSLYDRGVVTATECTIALVQLMCDADDDDSCLDLCSDLPDWFREAFLDKLETLEEADFYCRWFGIGDMRAEQQVHADALRQQALFRRLAPQIRNVLQHGRC